MPATSVQLAIKVPVLSCPISGSCPVQSQVPVLSTLRFVSCPPSGSCPTSGSCPVQPQVPVLSNLRFLSCPTSGLCPVQPQVPVLSNLRSPDMVKRCQSVVDTVRARPEEGAISKGKHARQTGGEFHMKACDAQALRRTV
ncbi:uncharacterized protein LOC127910927 isoform X46 [Oncorhynchus keta]|uniref:uncharacterized protein LOC127910927 isoform X44 n=1 Tax=Oncorhynchus keta TaxID=8018 RepID=UPI00227CB099|nr:uncharacterized protein LOC127910927 isoform X44 [Oncorhynchus keta]XP_052332096.1 uncharacterized protein LOC127910927 isoform X46 [Oncorhynchus keta]